MEAKKIEELWELLGKATPGPVEVGIMLDPPPQIPGVTVAAPEAPVSKPGKLAIVAFHGAESSNSSWADAHLHAALRNNAPALLDAAESALRLREQLKMLRQTLEQVETGRIIGSPRDYKTTVTILRRIATEALAKLKAMQAYNVIREEKP